MHLPVSKGPYSCVCKLHFPADADVDVVYFRQIQSSPVDADFGSKCKYKALLSGYPLHVCFAFSCCRPINLMPDADFAATYLDYTELC